MFQEENRFIPSEESIKKSKKSKDKSKDAVEAAREEKHESLLDMHLKNMKRKKKVIIAVLFLLNRFDAVNL